MANPAKIADMSGLYPAAIRQSVVKLDPRQLWHSPVMFVTAVVAVMTTLLGLRDLVSGTAGAGIALHIAVWLWLCVLFANFAEALAEGRGRARADTLRATKSETRVRVLAEPNDAPATATDVASTALRAGQFVYLAAGDIIPTDGEAVRGIASVNESAITGESAPVIREAGGDRSSVTGGTTIASDWIVMKVTAEPGKSFLDRMIALVEGAERQKTPNEIALNILLVGLTLIFLFVVVTLPAFASYSGTTIPVVVLGALFVTLIPTTIGGLLSAIGIAGMDRLVKANVIAKSGRAVEAAGDVDTLLLDKTGTITFGNRMADALVPAPGVEARRLAEAAALASLADETPEGKSIVEKAREMLGSVPAMPQGATPVAFTAQTRLSGLDLNDGRSFRKGAIDAVIRLTGQTPPGALAGQVDAIARSGGTPLLVAEGTQILGVVHLKDIVKPGVRERFAELRAMGIRTVMITGDNPLTAAAIAAEAGVDDFLAEATPEMKLDLIRREQAGGRLVAMCGDGSNDAPALAQADVGVAMNAGTPAAKEAANLIDLDSDPTKLIEVVMVGKQLLISRGALTTFSIANDVAKYFAVLPAIFVAAYPGLAVLNIMGLASPTSAILSAVIFNALVLIALVPLALRGVAYRPASAAQLLRRNLLVYGLGGLIVPFVGIKAIDLCLVALNLA
ncbi:potassium-transporting ATPase subunit KdpB [Frigidibacter albus]|uniref:Potassium-transporting ATPase ATP-binding subunit n=2 Tax=Frigidibacter albus TaxID=1465486 RepID=A0A6L8VE74_9RHOB|nr:potassium-transporting ATPase subunit KdpB [Frigidibacter albus]MZQ87530.1 potassium-transporting ATPase subunit KdpB [Frigidibacter albus]NBE29436.1 potassium-transporting ATPase subunit KdpB [Frigidibacter albus]GGH44928.1 potassium-transporting ATPase ATP-binding subunit [Frigidibacter albus]